MSLRQVLSIYNAERQLNEDDTALLNTLRRFTDSERALFVEQLSDKPQKKPGKGKVSGGGKSRRATGMQAQLNTRLAEQERRRQEQKTADDDSDGLVLCQYTLDGGGTCKRPADHNIHHLKTDSLYHPFVPPARSADGSLSASGAATSSIVSFEDAMGDALDAARAAAGE